MKQATEKIVKKEYRKNELFMSNKMITICILKQNRGQKRNYENHENLEKNLRIEEKNSVCLPKL